MSATTTTTMTTTMTPAIAAERLSAAYGAATVVRDLDLHVEAGEVVALLGPNGAGKTTTLLTLCGEHTAAAGTVRIDGEAVGTRLHERARDGLALLPEGRSVFPSLTVRQNLRVARCDESQAVELFPELDALLDRRAGLLSGGEQQMLSLARLLARDIRILLADELSMGLAPLVVTRLLQAVRAAADGGVAVLLVEQHATQALHVADRVYVLRRGTVALEADAASLRDDPQRLQDSYLME